MISLALAFFMCLLLSAFFNAAEMAFVSTNKLKLRELSDKGDLPARIVLHLYHYPQRFLTTLLVCNNVVNLAGTAIFTVMLQIYLGIANEWIVTAILAPVLIVFGEMVPKDYGRLQSREFLLRHSYLLDIISRLFYYPTLLILKAVDFFLGPFGVATHKSIFVDEEEFYVLIEESAKSGVVTHHEKQLIDTILNFERTHVEAVMIAVDKVPKVPLVGKIADVKETARRTGSKMVLVYEEIPSLIVGMIYVFDVLFEENSDQVLKNYLRSPIFLSRHTSIEKAFLMLQQKRQSFAVVTDNDGEVIGAVPIERLLAI
ncbi:MAG: DUF21 domain-containing protein [Candidatus Omnitrophica bacterium]|nr:DUF21 domain-containing protein [Candidatus Omnitrophota bacterium]